MSQGLRPDFSQLQKEWPDGRAARREEAKEFFSDPSQDVRAVAYFVAATTCRITIAEGRTPEECRQAAEYLKEALGLFPRWPEAHLNRGVALSELGEHDKMLDHYEKATNFFGIAGADPTKHPTDAALLGKIYLFRAHGRLRLAREDESLKKADIVKARWEFEKGTEILGRHPESEACRRWLNLADEIEVDLRTAETIHGLLRK